MKHFYFTPVLLIFYISCSPKNLIINQPKILSLYFENKITKLENSGNLVLEDEQQIVKSKVLYGFGVLIEEGDRLLDLNYMEGMKKYKKANEIFLGARDYQTKLILRKYPNFKSWLNNEEDIAFNKDDISDLYWLAAAIGGTIKSSRGNPIELIQLPNVGRLLRKTIQLDPGWGKGSLYSAMMSYNSSRLDIGSTVLKDSVDYYFKKAIEYSDSLDASVFVSYAESIHKPFQQKKEYLNKLNLVLNMETKPNSMYELSNLIAKRRAKWLISKTDDYFLE